MNLKDSSAILQAVNRVQEAESRREYDDVTGMETVESYDTSEDQALQEALVECQAVRALIDQPGWKWLNGMILSKLDNLTQSLLECTKMDEVVKLQESVKAYRSILNLIEEKINLGAQILEQLNPRPEP